MHILDPKSESPVLSWRDIPPAENRALFDYFTTHIQKSLQDTATKAARFTHIDEQNVSGISKGLLKENLDFITGSQELARQLFKIIKNDGRISACDLAVCFYNAKNQWNTTKNLALMKIDPSEVFLHKKQEDSQGKTYITFEIKSDVLPTTRENLQKCVFIRPLDPRPTEYDMMLLDRQLKVPIAKFFIKDFLNAEFALDSRERTERLYTCLVGAQNSLRSELEPQDDEYLRQAINSAITSTSINVDTWIKSLTLSEDQKSEIDQIVSQDLPDREFEIDLNFAQQLITKRRFKGDYDLRLEISAENYDKVIHSVKPINTPDAPSHYEIVIHSEKWDEIVKRPPRRSSKKQSTSSDNQEKQSPNRAGIL
ncbi:MAG TPA: nucleoid-associated protein [Rectinema sp.]|nr:nucleoid-associated protein [Methanothrix sp.]HQB07156.1 nucleoid-associated protein [Rectinema sp.]